MSRAGVYFFASLISSVSAALVLTNGPSYSHARSAAHIVKREQSVYNDCRTSSCQVAYLNSLDDFCLWAPSQPELDLSATRNTEHTLTAWCMKSTHGTRLIPDGTISWVHFVKTPEFIQITGVGNLTNINVPADGVASASGESNHVPGLVFTSAHGQPEQIYEWMSFVSQERFCFRACDPSGIACPQIHDIFGCSENVSGNPNSGALEDRVEDIEETPTVYQEALVASSHCSAYPPSCSTGRRTVGNGRAVRARRAIPSTSGSSTPLASSTATSTATATTITFPSSPASVSNATTLMNSTTSTSPAPTSTIYSFNRTTGHTHWHTRSHLNFTLSSTSTSFSSSSNPPLMSAALLPTSLTSTTSTTSSDLPSTSSVPSTSTNPASTPTPTSSSSSSSSRGTFSSVSPSPSPSSTPSTTPSSTSPTTPSSTSSTTPPLTSSSTSSSTSSRSSVVLTFAPPSPSSETTSSATFSSTFRNTATQLGSQCPPVQRDVVDAGSITPPPSLLICLILTITISIFIGAFSI